MPTRRAARLAGRVIGLSLAAVALLHAWRAIEVASMRQRMTADELAEWEDICRVPEMDCSADPWRSLRVVLAFGGSAALVFAAGGPVGAGSSRGCRRG